LTALVCVAGARLQGACKVDQLVQCCPTLRAPSWQSACSGGGRPQPRTPRHLCTNTRHTHTPIINPQALALWSLRTRRTLQPQSTTCTTLRSMAASCASTTRSP
jgi:hypothetical protein